MRNGPRGTSFASNAKRLTPQLCASRTSSSCPHPRQFESKMTNLCGLTILPLGLLLCCHLAKNLLKYRYEMILAKIACFVKIYGEV
jgi:hypothetical protein